MHDFKNDKISLTAERPITADLNSFHFCGMENPRASEWSGWGEKNVTIGSHFIQSIKRR